jgi:hypothetical protein
MECRAGDKCPGSPDKSVRASWNKTRLIRHFGPGDGTAQDWTANKIWSQAGIRFDVRLVDWCSYPPDPQPLPRDDWPLTPVAATDPYGTLWAPATTEDNENNVLVPDAQYMRAECPDQQQRRIDGFLNTNLLYGTPRMLNVYLWPKLFRGANGYGESPRRLRSEVGERHHDSLPTVWIESNLRSCEADNDPASLYRCQLLVAHELGHALGLKHACRSCDNDNCCRDLCWQSHIHPFDDRHREQRSYYYYRTVLGIDAPCPQLAWPKGGDHGKKPCCCGCEPDEYLRDGTAVGGDRVLCCPAGLKGRLMFPNVFSKESAGSKLLPGEIHSARSAARAFFYTNRWGLTWR